MTKFLSSTYCRSRSYSSLPYQSQLSARSPSRSICPQLSFAMYSHVLIVLPFVVIGFIVGIVQWKGFPLQSADLRQLDSNSSVNTSDILPGLHRSVSLGHVWNYSESLYDLGARSIGCECFNPGDQCCVPTSKLVAPYCMPNGSTCCRNTFCVKGETCCGDFCCAAVRSDFLTSPLFLVIGFYSRFRY